ncbi:MAG: cell fate regulator YaaT (PSP1 superfamily) [Bacteroidia bacterium]|jgi:cell fate regulator YaaT (PSP1 superfamily)|tara:strand:+ start:12308 stop:13663 length:1356 start_codon:yes stop_codon:yes gene_type:complete
MGCGSCGNNNGSHSPGCGNNGACSTGSCNKLNVYNWLTDMVLPEDYKPFNIVEVRFKGSKKQFYRNTNNLELFTGEKVIVDSDIGYDVGEISLAGELVKLHLKKYGVEEDNSEMRNIRSIASEDQVKKYQDYKDKEQKTLEEARTIALQLRLKMKISDIEFQGDGKKVTFYYTSEGRVDFRELIRRYASSFKSRIQMLQVSYREEASRLGGIGSCGRELCCSTWLTDYKVVSMGAAKTQNLSINMLKLSGQCGRLKCCLNYELETYHEAFNQFPNDKVLLKTESGVASLRKIDILKGTAWYCYEKSFDWIPVDVKRVNEIIALNKEGKTPITLSDTALGAEIAFKTLEFKDDLLGDTDLTRMDDKNKKSRGKGGNSRNNKSGNRNSNSRNNSPRNDRPKRDDTKKLSGNKPNDGSRSKPTNKKPNQNRKPKSEGNPPESKSGTSNKPDNKE